MSINEDVRKLLVKIAVPIKEWSTVIMVAILLYNSWDNLPIVHSLRALPAKMNLIDTMNTRMIKLENALYHSKDIIDTTLPKTQVIISLNKRIDTVSGQVASLERKEHEKWLLQ